MPRFDTPEPVTATLEFDVGAVRIIASDRADTSVEIVPNDPSKKDDVTAVEQFQVTCARGKLLIKGPRSRSLFGRVGSVDISVELPSGSDVHGTAPLADFICEGRFGVCRLKTSAGDLAVEAASSVHLKTDHGEVRVGEVAGDADVAGVGRMDIGTVGGTATVRNTHGETTLGEVTGELWARASNGPLVVAAAHAGAEVKAAYGSIRIGRLTRGRTVLQTATGDVEIGLPETTAAWLDVDTRLGSVRNSLTPADGPEAATDTAEIRARTGMGDIIIHRA